MRLLCEIDIMAIHFIEKPVNGGSPPSDRSITVMVMESEIDLENRNFFVCFIVFIFIENSERIILRIIKM